MVLSNKQLAERLRELSGLMSSVVWDLIAHSDEGAVHAEELCGAADVVDQWIEELSRGEEESKNED